MSVKLVSPHFGHGILFSLINTFIFPPLSSTKTLLSNHPFFIPQITEAQAPVPQDNVSPTPLSHTLTLIFFLSTAIGMLISKKYEIIRNIHDTLNDIIDDAKAEIFRNFWECVSCL